MKSGRCALRIGAVTMLLALAACSSAGDMASSRHAVEMFHFELDQAMYDEIWKTTSSEMRAAATKPALIKLLSAVHTKLGKVVATREVNWRENYNTGGTFVTLVMQTKYDHGTGEETFIFKPADVGAQLVVYNINSLDMMTS
jgi:hypothetical protein